MKKSEIIRILVEEGVTAERAEAIINNPPPAADSNAIFGMSEEQLRSKARAVAEIERLIASIRGRHPEKENVPYRCDECPNVGRCSIEPIARYFSEHEDEQEGFNLEKERLMNGSWKKVLEADCIILSPKDPIPTLITLALATGYVMGKGQPINDMELSEVSAASVSELILRMRGGLEG